MSGTTIFIILIIAFFVIRHLLKFKGEINVDREELNNQNLEDKFRILINGLNEYCYQGTGKITKIDQQSLNIYKQGSCQIVNIQYTTGILSIIWKFKYFQQEMVYKRSFPNARNVNKEWQMNVLEIVIPEFLDQYKIHEAKVDSSGIVGQKLCESGISEDNYEKAKDFLNY